MLSETELRERINQIDKLMNGITKQRDRLRMKRYRYKKLLEAMENMKLELEDGKCDEN